MQPSQWATLHREPLPIKSMAAMPGTSLRSKSDSQDVRAIAGTLPCVAESKKNKHTFPCLNAPHLHICSLQKLYRSAHDGACAIKAARPSSIYFNSSTVHVLANVLDIVARARSMRLDQTDAAVVARHHQDVAGLIELACKKTDHARLKE